MKEALWGGALVASQQNCANQCIDAANEKETDRAGGDELKVFKRAINKGKWNQSRK